MLYVLISSIVFFSNHSFSFQIPFNHGNLVLYDIISLLQNFMNTEVYVYL